MENTPTWGVEQVWGSDRFYHEGDVAEDMYAFVIDSGVSLDTNDLNIKQEWSKSFTSNPNPFDDTSGHGTAVASVIGAKANYQGLTGVAPGAQIVALKVFNSAGTFRQRVEAALYHARDIIVENDLFDRAVINMSLGGGIPDNHPAVRELADMGIKIVVSAGNSAKDVDLFSPASYGDHPNVYTISSNAKDGFYSGFTNFDNGDAVDDSDYSAPGSAIPTYNTDGTIRNRNGTSFAAPHVAGLLLMSDIKEGQTFKMSSTQVGKGMVPDPLAMFDEATYKHAPPPPAPPPAPPPPPNYDDILIGTSERDVLRGGLGDDELYGLEGRDVLRGGQGDDILDGGLGKDKLRGGMGADTFILNIGEGRAKVVDYEFGVDTLVIPEGELRLVETDLWNKIYVDGDLVAKVNWI